jgi:hypothetical protein
MQAGRTWEKGESTFRVVRMRDGRWWKLLEDAGNTATWRSFTTSKWHVGWKRTFYYDLIFKIDYTECHDHGVS